MKKLLIVLILTFLFLYQASTAKSIFDFSNDDETPVLSEQSRDSLALIYTDYLKLRQPEVAPTGFTTAFPPLAVNPLYKFAKDSTCFKFEGDRYKEGAELDSTGNYMIMYERLFEEDFNQTTVMNLDDYAKARLTYDDKVIWKKEVAKNTGNEESAGILDELAIDIPFKIKSKTFHRVFGGNKIGLRANGTLSLSMKYNTNYLQNSSYPTGESSGGDVKFEQTQDFSINGKIGTKVDVEIAQSTQKMDFENTMKITYTGESDEIVEKIEAGNISLSLPGTQFATFSGTNKGLYGIKTDLKLGNFKSTFIASLEKGESQELNLPLGVKKQTLPRNAADYAKMKRFFVDSTYREIYNNPDNLKFRNKEVLEMPFEISRIDKNSFHVFVTVTDNNQPQNNARLFRDGSKDLSLSEGPNVVDSLAIVRELPESQWDLDPRGWITLKSVNFSPKQYIAVAYSNESGKVIGSLADPALYKLQVIGRNDRNLKEKFIDLEWKNIYYLDATDISTDGFDLKIKKSNGGDEKEDFQTKNGVVSFNKSLDLIKKTETTLNTELLNKDLGLFIMPSLEPFYPKGDGSYIANLSTLDTGAFKLTTDTSIYRINDNSKSNFNLYFDFSSKSRISNLGFNVLEGSEVVMANSKKLERDKDYNIDYQSGQLSIIKDEYLSQNISIKYERASFFQLDQKVLLGNRWQYDFDESSFLGLSLLYYSKSLRDERIHVGYEPINNFVWDLNGLYTFDAPYLTAAADWLPLIQTDKESKIKIEGEIAQIIPDPNSLNKAYIDDFENSERKRSLGLADNYWFKASPPDSFFVKNGVPFDTTLFSTALLSSKLLKNDAVPEYFFSTADKSASESGTSFYWYNKKESETADGLKRPLYKEIYVTNSETTTAVKDQKFNTLNFKFRPYLNDNAFNSVAAVDKRWLWNGVMRYIPQGYMQNFSEIKYIELLVNVKDSINLNIDIGSLSEDIIPNGRLDEENAETDNKVLDDNDIGLDMKAGEWFYSLKNPASASDNDEPYAFKSYGASQIGPPLFVSSENVPYHLKSKTEKNRIYDTEDLNHNRGVETTISAYRYQIKFTPETPVNNPDSIIILSGSSAGLLDNWKLVRIPLNKMTNVLGYKPELTEIRYIKLWLNGASKETDVEIAAFDVVGNEWVAADQYKNAIEAKVISTENGSIYPKPDGIGYDPEKENKETALQVNINAKKRKEVYITKQLLEAESYMMYKSLDMWIFGGRVQGDSSWSNIDTTWSFFYRLGSDSNNYYQYSTRLSANDWNKNRMTLEIDSLTAIKSKRSDYNAMHAGEEIPKTFTIQLPSSEHKRYLSIVGNPTLQAVKYFAAGVLDRNYTIATAKDINTGFLLNDITLTNVRKNNAMAMRAAVSVNIADVANISAGITKKDADFHTVSEKLGSGSHSLNYDVSTSANIDKLFPSRWGVSLPVSYSYANSYSRSKFEGGTDILVDEKNIPDSVKTKQISESFTYSIKKSSKSDDPLLKYTIDNLSYSGTSNLTEGSNPTSKHTESENYSNNISYGLNLPVGWFSLPIFGWTKDIEYLRHLANENFNFFPNNYSVALSTNQGRTKTVSRKDLVSQSNNFTVARTFTTSLAPFSILKNDYSLTLNSDMYKQRRNLLDTTLAQSPNPGVAGNSGYVDLDNPVNPVVFTHRPGLRGYDRLFMLDFGELDTWKSSFNTSLQFDLTKWTAYSFSHNTGYNWNGNLASSEIGRTLSNSYSVTASTRFKSKEIFQSMDATYQEWFPAKETPLIPATDSLKTDEEEIPKLGDAEIPVRGGRGAVVTPEKKAVNFEVLKYFKESLNDISLTFGTNRSANVIKGYGLDQANLEFQLGFSRIPHNYTEGTMNWTGGFDWKIQTGLNLAKNLSLSNLSYTFKRSYSDDNVNFNGSDSKTQFILPPFFVSDADHRRTNIYDDFCLPLPDYGISYSGLKDLLKLDDIFTGIDLTHSKSSSRSEVWYLKNSRAYSLNSLNIPEFSTLDSSIFIIKSKKYNLSFAPVLGIKMTFKNQMNLDASVDYSFDLDEGYLYRKANSGSKKVNITYKTSAGYNQKGGFQTPFNFWPFSGKKMDNDIVYSFGASYGITRNYNATRNTDPALTINEYYYEERDKGSETIIASLSPKITYQLAKNINGSFSYSYSRRETKTVGNTDPEISADHIMDLTFTMKIVSK